MQLPQKNGASAIKSIMAYTYPRLYTGKEWYVGFYAFDPVRNTMRRKKIKINFIDKAADRRRYANNLMRRITDQLDKGWNPWIEADNAKAYHTFRDVCDQYKRYLTKLADDGHYRSDTYVSYCSYLRNIELYNQDKKVPIIYIYQFDREFVSDFLDHVYLDRENTPQTRDNYLGFLKTFSSYLVQHSYIKVKPTEGISCFGKRLKKKKRTIIEEGDMIRLHDYLQEKNKYYLLASYVLHYCLIRPKEMSMIRLKDISLKKQTIYISDTVSKNRMDGVVTLPRKVIELMIDLDIFRHAGDDYLFSTGFKPGAEYRDEKQFRDYWSRYVRKDLKFPDRYKFYSLKDTGITSMLKLYDPITVRDQARHANILMTEIYTPHDIQNANHLIMNHEGVF
ncbi:tyrosine-type recombinase/integrase [Parabacteroides provencensis]|uniref:tyrosine-type recombinase/integrase n=1 Tax=Parabacteroides provencensis TaxID=1944636 RepID=UPI000C161B6A|nr:site-specific integrase [Parabacteroides provencensis]